MNEDSASQYRRLFRILLYTMPQDEAEDAIVLLQDVVERRIKVCKYPLFVYLRAALEVLTILSYYQWDNRPLTGREYVRLAGQAWMSLNQPVERHSLPFPLDIAMVIYYHISFVITKFITVKKNSIYVVYIKRFGEHAVSKNSIFGQIIFCFGFAGIAFRFSEAVSNRKSALDFLRLCRSGATKKEIKVAVMQLEDSARKWVIFERNCYFPRYRIFWQEFILRAINYSSDAAEPLVD